MKRGPGPKAKRLSGQRRALRRKVIEETGKIAGLPADEAGPIPTPSGGGARAAGATPGLAEMAIKKMKRARSSE